MHMEIQWALIAIQAGLINASITYESLAQLFEIIKHDWIFVALNILFRDSLFLGYNYNLFTIIEGANVLILFSGL